MTKVTNEQIQKIANLARIHVTDAEVEAMAGKVSDIVSWVEQLNEIDTDNVEPMMAVENTLRMRDDEPGNDNITEQVLENTSERKLDFYAVPKFVG